MNRIPTLHLSSTVKIFVFIISLFSFLPTNSQADELKKTVLYLNSYHNGYKWSDELLEGVRNVLNESRFKVDLQIEYMDAKKFDYDSIAPNLLALYKEKFRDKTFDIIVISDNDALNFINQYRGTLFPGVPVVFCGVNDFTEADVAAGNITGVVELYDFVSTLKIAKKLHPGRKRVVVLIDNSTAGRTIRQQAENSIRENPSLGLDVEYWIQMSLEEAQDRVEHLPDDTFMFIAPYYQIIDGRFFTSEEVSMAISQHSSVPIYTGWQFMIGYGAVGGKVLSGINHGRIAGQIAIDILGGKSADSIPVLNQPGGKFYFDYNQLTRFGIKTELLPEDSVIINQPKNFYSLPKEIFWTIIISLILLLFAFIIVVGAMIERRKVERKITDQLAFQETLLDTIPQLISWKDVKGRYLGANRAFIEFFDTGSAEEMSGKTTDELVHDAPYAKWSIAADSFVTTTNKPLRKIRKKVLRVEGDEGWIEINKVPLLGQGDRLVGVLSTAENITKEQSLEKQLRQSQKMEAIGTLAGGIAHDFNNILTSIINSTELALGDINKGTQTESDLLRVLKASRRGGQLVQQILSFSRPSTEGFAAIDITRVVQEVKHLIEASMPANISVDLQMDGNVPLHVNADATQIHQALLNLCTNAYQALRNNGGHIVISATRYHPPLAADGSGTATKDQIRLAVSDNGPGIPPNIIDKIFDPFFSTKGKSEGTGLGLAVVHGIVKNHNGTIRVFSTENAETVFEILLPATSPDSTIRNGQEDRLAHVAAHVLFVEDEEDQLETTPRLLEASGFTVKAIKDPLLAIELVLSGGENFDILVTDFDMPTMSGADLAGSLPGLPAILVSGRNDALTAAAHHDNIQQVLIKPYGREELSEAIRKILINSRKHG